MNQGQFIVRIVRVIYQIRFAMTLKRCLTNYGLKSSFSREKLI